MRAQALRPTARISGFPRTFPLAEDRGVAVMRTQDMFIAGLGVFLPATVSVERAVEGSLPWVGMAPLES